MLESAIVRCVLCECKIPAGGSKYGDHLREWHNVTVQRVHQELMSREAGTGEGDTAAHRRMEEGLLQIEEVRGGQHLEEAWGGQLQGNKESQGGQLEGQVEEMRGLEDPHVNAPSNFFNFNQTLVVQAGSGKVNKYLHIDKAVSGNMIQVKGQKLLVVPDSINTEVSDCTGQQAMPRGVEELQDSGTRNMENIVRTSKKLKNHKKLRIFDYVKGLSRSTSSLRMKGPSGMLGRKTNIPLVSCSYCKLSFGVKGNLVRHIKQVHPMVDVNRGKKMKNVKVCPNVIKKKAETVATQRTAGDKPEPSHPKYSVMIADIVRNCENTRAGISRAGILKALLELPYNLGGQEDEKKNLVNVLMKRSLKKSVKAGSLKMAGMEGRKGSGHYKLADKKTNKTKTAGADGEEIPRGVEELQEDVGKPAINRENKEDTSAKKRRKKNPNMPKFALNGFILYCQEERPRLRVELPELRGKGGIARELGRRWCLISPKEKARFKSLVEEGSKRYFKEKELYVKSLGGGQ